MYKEKWRAAFEVEGRTTIIHDVQEGIEVNSMVKALETHRGRESTTKKFLNSFSGMAWLKTLRNALKFVKIANNKGRSLRISVQS